MPGILVVCNIADSIVFQFSVIILHCLGYFGEMANEIFNERKYSAPLQCPFGKSKCICQNSIANADCLEFLCLRRWLKVLKREAQIQFSLRHRNVVTLFAIVFEKKHHGILLEYMPFGSVDVFQRKYSPSWPFILSVARDVATAMRHLHNRQQPVIHGDLKVENVMIGADFVAKVIGNFRAFLTLVSTNFVEW